MKHLPDFDAVIFDFDGVIVDSTPLHILCWQKAYLQKFGQELPDPESLLGASGRHIARKISRAAGDESAWESLYELKNHFLQANEDYLSLVPGVLEFMIYLRRLKIPYGIGSNARRVFIDKVMARTPELQVTHVVSLDEVRRPKPHPDVFEKCATLIGVEYERRARILVIEDSPIGIYAAIAAGMTPIGLTTQLHRNALYNAGARHIYKDFLDLMEGPKPEK
jgi:beta-phosphoglucomutase